MSEASPPAPALEFCGVAVMRGGRPVVQHASFTLRPGEILLVRGPNGAGKTTVLRAAAGLLPVAEGAIDASGADLKAATVYCGHADGVKGAMTARENLAFWSALYGAPAALIDAALAAFDLAALAEFPAAILSAGQRRRLGLSRLAVANRPIWLLDEPMASMDAASAARLCDLVERHCAAGGSALVATHDASRFSRARTLHVGPAA